MRRAVLAAGAALLLAACGAEGPTPDAAGEAVTDPAAQEMLAEHGLEGLSPAEIVDELDRVSIEERSRDLMASVRVDELVLSDADGEVAVPLPEDRFYLSVAPYVEQTHECFYHSLTTCRGELSGEEIDVTIVDDAGEVLVDEQVTTFENGFAGFWLPRDVEGTMTISYDGLIAEAPIATDEESPTCVTTVQLT